ncbi:MAG: alpha-hydroxy-acid oxidizing protein [Alphaproteobacteria bacterium]|nr:alpha-hydroxy-acid oxidizing protein [Alphaproteobacteria bacterium]
MQDGAPKAYNIEDLRRMAKRRLPRGIFEFVDRGAEDEVALRNNRAAFESIKLRTHVLTNVSTRTLDTEIFGKTCKMPLGISPTGTAGLLSFGGEVGLAKAAAKAGVPCAVATNAMTPMEEIVDQAGGDLWFQLYMWSDKELSWTFVDRVKSVGFETLIVTVDGPVGANREYNHRNGFEVPLKYSPRLIAQLLAKPRWLADCLLQQFVKRGVPKFENYPPELMDSLMSKSFKRSILKNDTLDWDDLKQLRDRWPGNLLVKGILHPDDAAKAADCGADGVIVSNHGGRYLDASVATIQILPDIAARVGGRITVLVDSGFRRGTDVVKALALGADFVMAGRPTLYGAAVAGEAGAYRALEIFHEEIDRVMGQMGLHTIDEIGPDCLWQPRDAETPYRTAAE